MKFIFYQVSRRDSNLASLAKFYSYSPSYTSVEARQAYRSGKYVKSAIVEADNIVEAEKILNTNQESPLVKAEQNLRIIGIGDIAYNEQKALYFIRSQTGWDRIKI